MLLLALLLGACGNEAKQAPRGPETPGPGPTHFPCAHFEDLRHFLPEKLEGLPAIQEAASTGRYGEVSVSEAERSYSSKDEREVKVRIVDTSMSQKLGQAISAAAEEARPRAANDPTAPIFWKDKEVVGFVRYDERAARAEASLLVGNRYVVAVSSRGFQGTVEVRQVAQGIDLAGLARLDRTAGGKSP
jgi:hypothetical protein